ncbi:MAG TPA: DUF6493 family protein [Actinomycetes bacterium]
MGGDLPTYDQLRGVERDVLWGLLDELGTPPWSATYEYVWQRNRETWQAVRAALEQAAAGVRPASTRDRAPRWLVPLVREHMVQLSRTWAQGEAFLAARLLERLGLVGVDTDDVYVLALVSGLGDRRNETSRAAALRDDPDLVDRALWRVFQVEGGGEVSLANVDKFSQPEASWRNTFLELVADGTLPRDRVLTECLGALQRDFSAYRAGWFSSLYATMEPTIDEQADHQRRLRDLVRSQVSPTVTMAVKRLRAVGRSGLLDDPETVTALGPALLSPVKGTAVEAVRLLDDIATRREDLRPAVVEAVSAALSHPHADVQRGAVLLLDRLGAPDVARAGATSLEPSVQLLVGVGPEVQPSAGTPPAGMAVAEMPAARMPAAVTAADLPDRLAALMEDASDPLEVELVLGGLASCADVSRLAPLRKRAATVLARGPREGVQTGWLRGQLARLVLIAAGEQPAAIPVSSAPQAFLVHRLDEVSAVLAGREPPGRPVATPDALAGWLSPGELVRRITDADRPPRHHDVVAALLRLAPGDREDALALPAMQRIAGPLGQVVRHALGAAPDTDGSLAGPAAWWVAASRARAPVEPDSLLLSAKLGAAGQGRPVDARLDLSGSPHSYQDARGTHNYTAWTWNVTVDRSAPDPLLDQPTVVTDTKPTGWGRVAAEDWVGWTAMVWPHDAEHFLVDSCDAVLAAAASGDVSHDAARVLDALLRHPGRLGRLAAETVAAGLSATGRDQRARAVDAVLDLVPGRIPVDSLAAAMTHQSGLATATRWAQSLRDVAQTSADGSRTVVALLTGVLPELPPAHRGLHALLDLLHQEVLRTRAVVTDAGLRQWLHGVTGSSRAAVSAKGLLAVR